MSDRTILDVKGLNCPQPIVKTKKAIGDIPVGSLIEVHATDPGSAADFPAFCRKTGHELVEHSEAGGTHVFVIKRGK